MNERTASTASAISSSRRRMRWTEAQRPPTSARSV
jgi:hypothetical protein